MAGEVKAGGSTSPRLLPLVVTIDLLLAVGVFLVVAVVSPDHGLTATSLRQGVVLAVVFAAAPVAALAPSADSESLVALGGGMLVAGAVTTPGGNLLGPVLALSGLLLLLAGAAGRPKPTVRMIGWLFVYAVMLYAGFWLASDTGFLTGLAGFILALLVATSTHWGLPGSDRS